MNPDKLPLAMGNPTTKPKAPRTEKQAQASRNNGAKSQGPVTPEGRFHSSQSALRHGLSATKFTILCNEDPAQYTEVVQAFVADLQPATKAELRLVEKHGNLDWRLERFALIENALLNLTVADHAADIEASFEQLDGIACIAAAWRESRSLPTCLALLARYIGTLQRQQTATLSDFLKLEKRRRQRKNDPDLDPDYNPPYEQPQFHTLNKEPDGTPMHRQDDHETEPLPQQNEPGKVSPISPRPAPASSPGRLK